MSTETYIPRTEPPKTVHGLLALTYRDARNHFKWLEAYTGEPVGLAPYVLYEDYEYKRIMSLERGILTLHVCDTWYNRDPRLTRDLELWFRMRQFHLLDLPEIECHRT